MGGREGGEGGREGGEGGKEGGREGREGGRRGKGRRERGKEGGRETGREKGRGGAMEDRLTYCIVMSHRYTVLHLHYHNGGPYPSTYGGIPTP